MGYLAALFSLCLLWTPPSAEGQRVKKHRLHNIRQLTFGGQNAEAYFSADGKKIIFQSTRPPYGCDQIFTMDVNGRGIRRLSTGQGRTTCSFFFPDGKRFIYASTHLGGTDCPPPPDRSQGYVWPIYPEYDIFSARLDGSGLTRLTNTDGYDAEGVVSSDGKKILFTSMRAGDLDLYLMDADGTNVRRLTQEKGYDGGAFFPGTPVTSSTAPTTRRIRRKSRPTKISSSSI